MASEDTVAPHTLAVLEGLHVVALSEEVHGNKPFAAHSGAAPLVLWRDASGIVRALEDRCPHRRAPLSLGCVKPDGLLQCGYHGWAFDGEGQVAELPQLRKQAALPRLYRAEAYAVRESNGFVFLGAGALPALPTDLARHGRLVCAVDRARLIEMLIDGPQILLSISGIRITEYLHADPAHIDGNIVYERACRRDKGRWPDRFRGELPWSLRLAIDMEAGLCVLDLLDDARNSQLTAVLALTPDRRGTTAIQWRALDRRGASKHPPIVLREPEGAAMAALLTATSSILRQGPLHTADQPQEIAA